MIRDVHQRLRFIIAAIDIIRAGEKRLDAVAVTREEQVRLDAVVRQLAIIAEAASHLDDRTRATEPDIPWQRRAGIRIIFDHRYHAVDPDVIWTTVDRDLQPLHDAVERLLDRNADTSD